MKDQSKATESSMEENKTIGRRELLKALAAGGGAVAASAVVSGKWVKPVVEAGVLPAHAATSVLTYFRIFFSITEEDVQDLGVSGPSAIFVTVDSETGMANVQANNSRGDTRLEIDLDINGGPSNAFSVMEYACEGPRIPGASWKVVGYSLGDPNMSIANEGGEVSWTVTVPVGTGTLPDLECQSEIPR